MKIWECVVNELENYLVAKTEIVLSIRLNCFNIVSFIKKLVLVTLL